MLVFFSSNPRTINCVFFFSISPNIDWFFYPSCYLCPPLYLVLACELKILQLMFMALATFMLSSLDASILKFLEFWILFFLGRTVKMMQTCWTNWYMLYSVLRSDYWLHACITPAVSNSEYYLENRDTTKLLAG